MRAYWVIDMAIQVSLLMVQLLPWIRTGVANMSKKIGDSS